MSSIVRAATMALPIHHRPAPRSPSLTDDETVSSGSSASLVEKLLQFGSWTDDETVSNTSSASLDRHLLQSGPWTVVSPVPAKYPSLSGLITADTYRARKFAPILKHRGPAPLGFRASFDTVVDWIDTTASNLQLLALGLRSRRQIHPDSHGAAPEELNAPPGDSTGETPPSPPGTGHGRSGNDGGVGGSGHGPGSSPPGEPSPQAPSSSSNKISITPFRCFAYGRMDHKYAVCQTKYFQRPSEYWQHLERVHGILTPESMHCISSAAPGCETHRSLEDAWFWCTRCRPAVNKDTLEWEFRDYGSYKNHHDSKGSKGSKGRTHCKEQRNRQWQDDKIKQAHIVAEALEARMDKCRCGPGCPNVATTPRNKRKRGESHIGQESAQPDGACAQHEDQISAYKKRIEDLERVESDLKQRDSSSQREIHALKQKVLSNQTEIDTLQWRLDQSINEISNTTAMLVTAQRELDIKSGKLEQARDEIDYYRGMERGKTGNNPIQSSITDTAATEVSTLVQPEDNNPSNLIANGWIPPR